MVATARAATCSLPGSAHSISKVTKEEGRLRAIDTLTRSIRWGSFMPLLQALVRNRILCSQDMASVTKTIFPVRRRRETPAAVPINSRTSIQSGADIMLTFSVLSHKLEEIAFLLFLTRMPLPNWPY